MHIFVNGRGKRGMTDRMYKTDTGPTAQTADDIYERELVQKLQRVLFHCCVSTEILAPYSFQKLTKTEIGGYFLTVKILSSSICASSCFIIAAHISTYCAEGRRKEVCSVTWLLVNMHLRNLQFFLPTQKWGKMATFASYGFFSVR